MLANKFTRGLQEQRRKLGLYGVTEINTMPTEETMDQHIHDWAHIYGYKSKNKRKLFSLKTYN